MGLYLGKEKISNISAGMPEIIQGTDTSDATATADDILRDKTAYVNGEKISGKISTIGDNSVMHMSGSPTLSSQSSNLYCQYPFTSSYAFKKGASIEITIPLSNFGTATAADVTSGKTFTSSAGLKITGTKTESGSSTTVPTYTFVINNSSTLGSAYYYVNGSGKTSLTAGTTVNLPAGTYIEMTSSSYSSNTYSMTFKAPSEDTVIISNTTSGLSAATQRIVKFITPAANSSAAFSKSNSSTVDM